MKTKAEEYLECLILDSISTKELVEAYSPRWGKNKVMKMKNELMPETAGSGLNGIQHQQFVLEYGAHKDLDRFILKLVA